MWPWSTIRRLVHAALLDEQRLASLSTAHESLRHDYECLRTDYARAVELLGGMAARPHGGSLLGPDPYAEDEQQPKDWLTPEEDEPMDVQAVETAVSSDSQ